MKNILVALVGLTPQVVSETLFVLSIQKGIHIDEILIITTDEGKKAIYSCKSKADGNFYSLFKEIYNLCSKFKIHKPLFNDKQIIVAQEENINMPDVKTDKQNILFPNVVTEIIKNLTVKENNNLYCLISGGRKSMSAYLGFVLSIYAREKDELIHIIASKPFEKSYKYYPDKKNDKNLTLSHVPYLKLRSILGNNNIDIHKMDYTKLINKCQKELIRQVDVLRINIAKHLLIYNDKQVSIQAKDFMFYVMLVLLKEDDIESINITKFDLEYGNEAKNNLNTLFNIYLKCFNKSKEEYISRFRSSELEKKWWNAGLRTSNILHSISEINRKISELFDNNTSSIEEYKIRAIGTYGQSLYGIYNPYHRFIIE